jgi:hypothetical protein
MACSGLKEPSANAARTEYFARFAVCPPGLYAPMNVYRFFYRFFRIGTSHQVLRRRKLLVWRKLPTLRA